MKKEPSTINTANIEQWIRYLVERDNDHQRKLELLSKDMEEMDKKLHLLVRSVLKLYKNP